MGCRVSRWRSRKGKLCRTFTCNDRVIVECAKHSWWKEIRLPEGSKCKGKCTEETIVMHRPSVKKSKRK